MRSLVFFSILFGLSMVSTVALSWELKQIWSIDNQFVMPESAAYDALRKVIYVSNVNQYAKDSNGFISRVAEDGSHFEVRWLTGLHSPTGLAVNGDFLYAVDYDALVIISLADSTILKRVPAEDAENIPVLNDVAVAPNGEVYVSGSNSRNIYKLTNGKLTVWLHDSEVLKHANGLWLDKNHLFHGGSVFTVFDVNNKRVVPELSDMGQGMAEIDGISQLAQNVFVVSLIDDDKLWLLEKGQSARPLTQQAVKGIDMQYVPEKRMLIIPRVGNSLSAYQLEDK